MMNTPSVSSEGTYESRFFADVMLGTLARWLRILGYDTSYKNSIDDDELVRSCIREGRIALTRDRRLAKRRQFEQCLLIQGNTLSEQLTEVLDFTKDSISRELILSRCLECNAPIERIQKESVKGDVPLYVYRTQDSFSQCLNCGRIYWAGTHRERILKRLKHLVTGLDLSES
jgi:uncharacterized protein with PIN domain